MVERYIYFFKLQTKFKDFTWIMKKKRIHSM